jgi:hypothetical protein
VAMIMNVPEEAVRGPIEALTVHGGHAREGVHRSRERANRGCVSVVEAVKCVEVLLR